MKKTKAKYPLPIREWSEDDRPLEKLLKKWNRYFNEYDGAVLGFAAEKSRELGRQADHLQTRFSPH